MIKTHILFLLILAGLNSSESGKENFVQAAQGNVFNRNLSVDVIGSVHFTFEHNIKFEGASLPSYMWGGSCGIGYQFSPHMVLSCAVGYSYTKNLKYPMPDFGVSEMKFSMTSFLCLISLKDANYIIGSGIDISYIDVSRTDWSLDRTMVLYTNVANASLVRPIVNASARSNIIDALYLKIRMESRILHFVKIGSKEIHLPKVQPSICIGLEYIFNL